MRVVESTRHGGDYPPDLIDRHPRGEPVGEQSSSIAAVDEVH
jgi:hypothetical protein